MAHRNPHFIHLIQNGKLINDGLVGAFAMSMGYGNKIYNVATRNGTGTINSSSNPSAMHVGGAFGGALRFTRANVEYVSLGDEKFGNTGQGSICVWCSLGTVANSTFHTLFGYGGDNEAQDGLFSFDISKSSGALRMRIAQVSNTGSATFDSVLADNLTLENVGFKHLALTSNGTAYNLFIDAQPQTLTVSSGTNSGDWLADTTVSGGDARIGGSKFAGSATNHLGGDLFDLRVYNRALARDELALIFAGLG